MVEVSHRRPNLKAQIAIWAFLLFEINAPLAQLDRASVFYIAGYRFESCMARQISKESKPVIDSALPELLRRGIRWFAFLVRSKGDPHASIFKETILHSRI